MVHGEVVGLMNGELVMGGILEEDCKDRMADRYQSYTQVCAPSLHTGVQYHSYTQVCTITTHTGVHCHYTGVHCHYVQVCSCFCAV